MQFVVRILILLRQAVLRALFSQILELVLGLYSCVYFVCFICFKRMFIQLFMHGTSCISIMQAISCIYTLMQNWYILSNVPWRIKSTCSTSSLDCWMIMQCCVVWFQTQAPHWRFDGSVSWLGVHELLLELAAVGSAEYLCLNGCFCEWRTIHSILTIIEIEWYLWFKQLYANPKSSVCFDIHCYTLE